MATQFVPSQAESPADAIRARHEFREGWSLPAYFYLSADRYHKDIAALRETTWFMAGHESQIPMEGDFRRFAFAGESVIVVRSKTGRINAFYNVCRHRGSHLCLEDSGNIKAFVCPYHAWTYKLDGQLLRPRSMPRDFDPSQFGLVPCHVESLDGIIFVSLARGDPPGFDEFARRFPPFIGGYGLKNAKVIVEERVMSHTNWKLPLENFQECYHCPNAHKDLARVLLSSTSAEPVDQHGETYTDRMRRADRAVEPFFDGPDSLHMQSAVQLEIGSGHASATMDGTARSRFMGKLAEWSGGWTVINFNAFAHAVMLDDYVQLIYYTPLDAERIEATMLWLVHEDAVEGVDYNVSEIAELFRITMIEDKKIIDDNQRGISSSAYSPCPLSIEEDRTSNFHTWYIRNIVDAE